MSKFLTPLVMRNADDTDDGKWILEKALVYQSDVAHETFIVPAGFVTDLASVPRIPLVYDLFGATSNEAAVVHDYLYSTRHVPRDVADAVLKEASQATGVPSWRRWPMWLGVRMFGGSHYAPPPNDTLTGSTDTP